MRKLPIYCFAVFIGITPAFSATTPQGGKHDVRMRTAHYNPAQVYLIETDLKFSTTIHFERGERFEAVIAGDTTSFDITPVENLGNVVSIKPHVRGAVTNMTVITNRRTYNFELREGRIKGQTGRFYDVRFTYPKKKKATPVKTIALPKNYNYLIAGEEDFAPATVYDDGEYTYFTFPKGIRQPAIFKADADGRERTINWTQQGNTVRILGVNQYWTLRIDDRALCIARDNSVILARD